MAFNIAANQYLARPITSMYEGRALRAAEELHQLNMEIGEQEKELNQIKLDEARKPKEQPKLSSNDYQDFVGLARDAHAGAYHTYTTTLEKTKDERMALAAAQKQFDQSRQALASQYGIDYANSMDPDFQWTPEESLAAMQTSDSVMDSLKGPTGGRSAADRLRIEELQQRPQVAEYAKRLGRSPTQTAIDIVDGNLRVSQPDSAGRVFITDETTGQTFQTNDVISAGNLADSEDRVRLLDSVIGESEDIFGRISGGETFGPGNILQRGLQSIGQVATAPVGGWFDSAFLEERLSADAVRRFNQGARAALVNSSRFPVWEQQRVESLLLQPNDFSLGTVSAKVKFLDLVTYMTNRREQEMAFQENRKAVSVERPRLGVEVDPLLFDSETFDETNLERDYPRGTWFINPITGKKGVIE